MTTVKTEEGFLYHASTYVALFAVLTIMVALVLTNFGMNLTPPIEAGIGVIILAGALGCLCLAFLVRNDKGDSPTAYLLFSFLLLIVGLAPLLDALLWR